MKKARVKKTGEIVHVDYVGGVNVYVSEDYVEFDPMELEFDVDDSPDYWEKLKHQAAINIYCAYIEKNGYEWSLAQAIKQATALVEKLKGE